MYRTARGSRNEAASRSGAFSLIELTIALVVVTVGVLGFLGTFYSTASSIADAATLDEESRALERVRELLRRSPDVYRHYDGGRMKAPDLYGPSGEPAYVDIRCIVDEFAIPPEFGPIQDIDGSGAIDSRDCSSTHKILPVVLTLSYVANEGPRTLTDYVLLLDGRGEEKLTLQKLLEYFRDLVEKNLGTDLADDAEDVVTRLLSATEILLGTSSSGGLESELQNAMDGIEDMITDGLLDPLEGEAYLRFLEDELSALED